MTQLQGDTSDMGATEVGGERNDGADFRKPAGPIRVRIIGTGLEPWAIHIVDAETGRELSGVTSLRISANAQDLAQAELTLCDLDYDLEVLATARRFGLEPRPLPTTVDMVGDEYGPAVQP